MLVTDRFVFVHMPKTGGTFVTEALKRIHSGRSDYGPLLGAPPKHGTRHDIPQAHRHKPIVSAMRNPFDWYVSQFEFAWWKGAIRYEPKFNPTPAGYAIEKALPSFKKKHPRFPEISFPEFVELCHLAVGIFNEGRAFKLGLFTHSFIRFFYENPTDVLLGIEREGPGSSLALPGVELLRTDRLNQGLHDFLLSVGYRSEDLDFILQMDRVHPLGRGRTKEQTWEKYYDAELISVVRESENPLFQLFPEYNSSVKTK